ncbi:MAG: hypothetical protein JWN62_2761 [Acidimicrobiales bacterium]|nr:hypothetical protein [Acidimicrobiales bacterium]
MDAQLLSLLQQEKMSSPAASDADCIRMIAARAIDELGVDRLPVNLDWVTSYFDITEIVSDPTLEVSGCLIRLEGKTIIRVRSDDVPGRQRFTIGHECGHTFLPGYYLKTQYRCAPVEFRPVKKKVQADSDEVLCDIAASEIILPEVLVLPLALTSDFGLDTVEVLAEAAQASLVASARRLVDAWPEPACLVAMEVRTKPIEAGKGATAKLRVTGWHAHGDGWPFFIRHKSVEESLLRDALEGADVHAANTTLTSICSHPISGVELHARNYPYVNSVGERCDRVIALLRRPGMSFAR